MFIRFDRVPACDRRTDGQTDRRTDVQPISITCFSIADARKNCSGAQIFRLLSDAIPTNVSRLLRNLIGIGINYITKSTVILISTNSTNFESEAGAAPSQESNPILCN